MDAVINGLYKLAEGNTFAGLFFVACAVVLWFYRQRETDHKAHAEEIKAERAVRDGIAAERLTDAKAMTQALQQSATANLMLEQNAEERGAMLKDLSLSIALLVQKFEGAHVTNDRRLETIERALESMRSAGHRSRGGSP